MNEDCATCAHNAGDHDGPGAECGHDECTCLTYRRPEKPPPAMTREYEAGLRAGLRRAAVIAELCGATHALKAIRAEAEKGAR
jgi:hypothetical protein